MTIFSLIPDELNSAEAAPLFCAGITTYNALPNAALRGEDLEAVQGIGGLGHLGIQFARHMGFQTVEVRYGCDKEKPAQDLGTHAYIGTAVDDAAAVLQRMGGARAVLVAAPSGRSMGSLVSGFAVAKFIVVGVPQDQIKFTAFPLAFEGRSVYVQGMHYPALALAHVRNVDREAVVCDAEFLASTKYDATFALWMMFVLGKHAMFGQDPPMYLRSTTATCIPSPAKVHAAMVEPVPPPRITRSNSSGCVALS